MQKGTKGKTTTTDSSLDGRCREKTHPKMKPQRLLLEKLVRKVEKSAFVSSLGFTFLFFLKNPPPPLPPPRFPFQKTTQFCSLNPIFSRLGRHANFIMGGGPHMSICASVSAPGSVEAIISEVMKPLKPDHRGEGRSKV